MENRKPESKSKGGNMKGDTPFRNRSLGGKALYVCKVIVMFASGGFIFPNII
jgi:hypothetical protein